MTRVGTLECRECFALVVRPCPCRRTAVISYSRGRESFSCRAARNRSRIGVFAVSKAKTVGNRRRTEYGIDFYLILAESRPAELGRLQTFELTLHVKNTALEFTVIVSSDHIGFHYSAVLSIIIRRNNFIARGYIKRACLLSLTVYI